jgi:SAM-dependent methyltransferase
VPAPDRLGEVVETLAAILGGAGRPRGGRLRVAVRGPDHEVFAGHLGRAVAGLPVDVVTGPEADLHVAIRTAPTAEEDAADVEVEWRDRTWPVLRHVAAHLPYAERARRRETQAFFAIRAPGWDARFGDDGPAYAAALRDAGLHDLSRDAVVADVGCGTGRALPVLRDAVGPAGTVLGVDVTAEMLEAARHRAEDCGAGLLLADALRLPLADAALDAVFGAGLLPHLPDPAAGLAELARVTRPGGTLVLFHPVGRAALAARQGRVLSDGDTLAEGRLGELLAATGWVRFHHEDAAARFLALAARSDPPEPR